MSKEFNYFTHDELVSKIEALRKRVKELEAEAAAIPEGWQLVPIEPTKEMIRASHDVLGVTNQDSCGRRDYIGIAWHNMLSAAPKPEELK